ncbi:hypothetical protein CA13_29270 [Planctomycetes bacterium CA13]|uniref:DUF1254 domain-containing protein n=1 Tax=Novipirellula herctigrandis TaxID=2527986 RepID=A0A5C5Z2C9_9BACT|nr:hypothetical protein CA13_29270 [Planctomycetes bacterium CA13]
MNTKTLSQSFLAALITMSLVTTRLAQGTRVEGSTESSGNLFESAGAEAKQTSEDFKPADETMQTRFGNLEFPGGYPTNETVQKVYDELDLQRATQLYLDMYPALSMHGLLKGVVRDYGVRDCSDVFLTANRLDSKALFLTGNTESLYAFIVVDLKADRPTVIEVPLGVIGPFDDHNFKFVFDFGPTGPDKGKGRKYLVLPPDYKGDVPGGNITVSSTRGVDTNSDGSVDIYFGKKAPKGKEKNFIKTDPDKGFFVVFRFYGPLEGYIEKTWVMNDFELLK